MWPSGNAGTVLAALCLIAGAYLAAVVVHRLRRGPPGPWVVPLFGDSTLIFARTFVDYSRLRHTQFGPVVFTWLFGEPSVLVADYAHLKQLLGAEHDLVESDWPASVKALLGKDAVTVTTGAAHSRLRKLLNPTFIGPGAVARYLPRMVELARRCCAKWADVGHVKGVLASKEFTFLVALEIILGFEGALLSEKIIAECTRAFEDWDAGLFSFPINVAGFAFHKAMRAKAYLMDLLEINLRRLKEHGPPPGAPICMGDVLALRNEDGEPMSMGQLKARPSFECVSTWEDLCMTLLFAGHDTSSSTITRALQQLANHPAVIDRLRAEQAEVVAKHGDEITDAALRDMTYAEAVVKEVIRRDPIVGSVVRRALKPFDLGGFRIQKGWKLFLEVALAMQNDSRFAHETGSGAPDKFYPERWLREDGKRLGEWLAFGAGPRMCLGYIFSMAEVKVLLAVLARDYEWVLDNPDEPYQLYTALPAPICGLPMRIGRLPAKVARRGGV